LAAFNGEKRQSFLGKPAPQQDKMQTTQQVSNAVSIQTNSKISKQPSTSKKQPPTKVAPSRIQPGTGESLDMQQFTSEPNQMSVAEQLSGLFQSMNNKKQRQTMMSNMTSIYPSQITSPNNNSLTANQPNSFSQVQSPH